MDKHVEEILELAEHTGNGEGVRYIQNDCDYPVDPLDLPDYSPAPGKAATEEREGVEGND